MCPITLSIIGTTLATTLAAAGSAAGAAAGAVGGAIAGTIGAAAGALGIGGGAAAAGGTAAAAGTITTAAGVAITAPTVVGTGAAVAGTLAPTAVTMGVSGASLLTAGNVMAGVTAAVGVGQGIHQKKEADDRAKAGRKAADETARVGQTIASDQAARAVREEAEGHTEAVIKGAELEGQYKNLQNKGQVQMAAYLRHASRATQADQNARDMRVSAIKGSERDAFQQTSTDRRGRYSTIRGGSNLGLGISIAGAGLSGASTALRHSN